MMNNEIINCYQLDVTQDIPKELIMFKANCKTLIRTNKILKGALIATGIGICAYFIYKIYSDEKEEQRK